MFIFWGDGSSASKALVDAIRVRSTENFNWTFIFILAVVFYVYWSEMGETEKSYEKNYKERMEAWFWPFGFFKGEVRIHPVCDTAQVKDYSEYEMAGIPGERKLARREKRFPEKLAQAYEIGKMR